MSFFVSRDPKTERSVRGAAPHRSSARKDDRLPAPAGRTVPNAQAGMPSPLSATCAHCWLTFERQPPPPAPFPLRSHPATNDPAAPPALPHPPDPSPPPSIPFLASQPHFHPPPPQPSHPSAVPSAAPRSPPPPGALPSLQPQQVGRQLRVAPTASPPQIDPGPVGLSQVHPPHVVLLPRFQPPPRPVRFRQTRPPSRFTASSITRFGSGLPRGAADRDRIPLSRAHAGPGTPGERRRSADDVSTVRRKALPTQERQPTRRRELTSARLCPCSLQGAHCACALPLPLPCAHPCLLSTPSPFLCPQSRTATPRVNRSTPSAPSEPPKQDTALSVHTTSIY